MLGILPSPDAIQLLQPLGDRLLVRAEPAEKATAGGVLLADSAKEKPSVGSVVAVGPGLFDEEKKEAVPVEVAAGATVMYARYAGSEFQVRGEGGGGGGASPDPVGRGSCISRCPRSHFFPRASLASLCARSAGV